MFIRSRIIASSLRSISANFLHLPSTNPIQSPSPFNHLHSLATPSPIAPPLAPVPPSIPLRSSTTHLRRHYTTLPKPIHQFLSNVPSRHRRRAIQEAQQALIDHLHTTRAVQYTYAERISRNSIFSLSNAISKIDDFSITNFAERFSRWLTYHPFDEIDFFYESIGIDYKELRRLTTSPDGEVFINQDFRVFNVACVLCGLGFPWKRLGELYRNEARVFEMEGKELGDRVLELKDFGGFKNAAVVGMCLAYPELLLPRDKSTSVFGNVGKVVADVLKAANGKLKSWENTENESLDFWYELTVIVKLLYDIGVERGSVCSVIDWCRKVFVDYSVEDLVEKVGFFCKLGVEKRDVVMLILERPELVGLDLENRDFSLLGFLKHFRMSKDEVACVAREFPYALGRNKMENLPSALRVMDLQNWFFDRLKNGSHAFLGSYVMDDTDIGADKLFKDGLKKITFSSHVVDTVNTLRILHGIGFGENAEMLRVLDILKKYNSLQESFDCLVYFGADYSKLCRSIACWPSILRQDPYTLTEKLDFFVNEMGLSWSYFYIHPECFDFDLDKRIKPRLKFYDWLAEKGLDTGSFSLCKKIKQRDEAFVISVSNLHPAAPKHFFECFAHSPKVHAPLNHNYPDLPIGCSIQARSPSRYCDQVIQEAQQALTDYLHTTRSIPVAYAEEISKHSVSNISKVISKLNFSVSTFSESFIDYVQCHHELDFFYESIGIDVKDIPFLSPASKKLNIKETNAFNVACALYGLDFPWNRLGELYKGAVFSKEPKLLSDRVLYLKTRGFKNVAVVGMCLTFPELLQVESENGDADLLLNDIKRVYELTNDVHQVLYSSYEVFRKMKLLYDIGFAKGELFGSTYKIRTFFVEYSEEALNIRIEYFCKLGVCRKDVALFLLKSPEVIGFDLNTPELSVLSFLKHFGMSEEEIESFAEKFPHIMGRNKMANMPCVLRALDLQNWFFNQINNGSHELLGNYATKSSSEYVVDKYYKEGLDQIRLSKSRVRTLSKLKFLHAIGLGENRLTMELLPRISGHHAHLQERFDCFINLGANYSKLCWNLLRVPTILNSNPDAIKEKLKYLFDEMGLSMSDLYKYPLYLESDLYRRINPRYRFYEWLIEKGVSTKPFSLVTLITTKGTRFMGMTFRIHPAAPKQYLERFLYREI